MGSENPAIVTDAMIQVGEIFINQLVGANCVREAHAISELLERQKALIDFYAKQEATSDVGLFGFAAGLVRAQARMMGGAE